MAHTVDGNSPTLATGAGGVPCDGWIVGANVGAAAGTGTELGVGDAICTIAGPLKNGVASYR